MLDTRPWHFEVPTAQAAGTPPEAEGRERDDLRLLVADRDTGALEHRRTRELPELLEPGDALVLNVSQTIPAAVTVHTVREPARLHLATPLPDGTWVVEPRRPAGAGTTPLPVTTAGVWPLPGGGRATLTDRYPDNAGRPRLWRARLDLPMPLLDYLEAYGEPIRYAYVPQPWPIDHYQTVHGIEPGSAEMPSAGRPLTDRLMTRLVVRGIDVIPVVLHCGVSSADVPQPERLSVSATSARRINATRSAGGRVVAVGTTVVRAVESASRRGIVGRARGWTDLVLGPQRPATVVDGLLTGWHEPEASHLRLLEAIADRSLIEASYAHAVADGYRWHEFGDLHLLR